MNTVNVGQFLFNSILPEEYRDEKRNFHDPDMLNDLLTRMAKEIPSDQYRDVLRDVFKLGADITYFEGSSFSLNDLKVPEKAKDARKKLSSEVNQILVNPNFTKKEKDDAIIAHVLKNVKGLQKVMMEETDKENSGLAKQVKSKSRGGPADLQSLLLGDMLMEDAKGNAIPIPMLHGYAEGVDPAEYFSNSYGTRMGVLSTKQSVAESGYLCLVSGTMVRLDSAGGSCKIQDIKVGDMVFGSDLNANRTSVPVVAVFDNGNREVRDFTFTREHQEITISATDDHKVLMLDGSIRTLGSLQFGDSIPVLSDKMDFSLDARSKKYWAKTYDIEVDHPDHLFVLANGAVVSNSKRMKQVAHRQVITEDDCGTTRSIEVDTKDPDNIGSVLAVDTEFYKAGTPITATVLKRIKDDKIHVRSALTCNAKEGLCAKCVGIRETGEFPDIGDNVGIIAGQSVGEKATQKALCLHEDTMVFVVDRGDVRISDVKVGDLVLASDLKGVRTPTPVIALHDNGLREVNRYEMCSGKFIECTKDHKVLTGEGRTRPISKCEVKPSGEHTKAGDHGVIFVEPIGLKHTYDIEIDTPDHLFLLSNGCVVSNSKKHSAGRVTGEEKSPFVNGFDLIEQLMSVPKSFTDAAITSESDGVVESIEEAPQGGLNITVEGKVYHVPSHMTPIVRKGDTVEPGDLLSNGIPDPSQLIKHKGIGETRRIFTDQLREATGASRRNTEIMAKAFVDYIKITEPDLYPNTAPDDIMKYSDLAKSWTPRAGFRTLAPRASVGSYLETPVAQYTIGTRITPNVANDLSRKGFKKIDTHENEPPFKAIMVPSVRALTHASDWQERMGGFHLKDSLLDAASRGMSSDTTSTSYIPGILKGTGFGEELRETGKY